MRLYDNIFQAIINEGIEKGFFRKGLEMHHIRAVVFGTMDYIGSLWVMLKKESKLVNELNDFFQLVFNVVRVGNAQRN